MHNSKICKKLYRTEWKWPKIKLLEKGDIIEEISFYGMAENCMVVKIEQC